MPRATTSNSDSESEDSHSDDSIPQSVPKRKPVIIRAATKPKTINVDVDDFFSFNSRPSFEAKKQQYQPSPKAISVANPLLSLTKRPVDSTESDSDTDASTDSRQRNHSPTHSPLKRARCELTPPPPEMPHVKLFPSQPRPVLETLRLEPSENAEWTLKLEPELQRTLQAAKTSKLIDAAEVEQEGNDAKINIRVIPPESLGKPMIIQYNPANNFEQLLSFICNRFQWNPSDTKLLYKDVPVMVTSTPKALQMLDKQSIRVMSNQEYLTMMQTKRQQRKNLLEGKVTEELNAERTEDLRVDLTVGDGAGVDLDSYVDTGDETDANEDDGPWLLLKITNQEQKTTKYKLRPDTLVNDLIAQYKRQTALADSIRVELEFDGEPLEADNPISTYDCENGDQLSARHLK